MFFFFITLCLLCFSGCFSGHAWWRRRRPDGGKKNERTRWTSRASHAQFLVRLATKITTFFICLAAFSLVGPAGPICFVDKWEAATSMVWKHYFTPWCESSSVLSHSIIINPLSKSSNSNWSHFQRFDLRSCIEHTAPFHS